MVPLEINDVVNGLRAIPSLRRKESNHLKRALLVHPWGPCETGDGTTLRTACMPWTLIRIPIFRGKKYQI